MKTVEAIGLGQYQIVGEREEEAAEAFLVLPGGYVSGLAGSAVRAGKDLSPIFGLTQADHRQRHMRERREIAGGGGRHAAAVASLPEWAARFGRDTG